MKTFQIELSEFELLLVRECLLARIPAIEQQISTYNFVLRDAAINKKIAIERLRSNLPKPRTAV